jgi:phosphatidylinositol alpha-1,6-mannosyltransferase
VAQVAGRSGGSDDAVFDGVTGVVVENPRSPRELAEAIESLIRNDERRTLYASQARTVALSRFSWETLAHELSQGLEPFDHFSRAPSRA